MTSIGKPERATQDRVRTLLRDELRDDDLGAWAERGDRNSHIEEHLLTRLLPREYRTAVEIPRPGLPA